MGCFDRILMLKYDSMIYIYIQFDQNSKLWSDALITDKTFYQNNISQFIP